MPPQIDLQADGEWTINGIPRATADKGCQIIQVNPDACATCPLAVKVPDAPMSAYLKHLLFLDDLKQAGAQIPFDYLTMPEWRGMALLNRKREEKRAERIRNMGNKKK